MLPVAMEVNGSGCKKPRQKGSVLRRAVAAAAHDGGRTLRSSRERRAEGVEVGGTTTPREEGRTNGGDVPRHAVEISDGGDGGGGCDDDEGVQSVKAGDDGYGTHNGAVSEPVMASVETDVKSATVSDVSTGTRSSLSAAAVEVTGSSATEELVPQSSPDLSAAAAITALISAPVPSTSLPPHSSPSPSPPSPPPRPSTSPISSSPLQPFSSPPITPSSTLSAAEANGQRETEAPATAAAVSTFDVEDGDDFGEFETASTLAASGSRWNWGLLFDGDRSPNPGGLQEALSGLIGGPQGPPGHSGGAEDAAGRAVAALIVSVEPQTTSRGGPVSLDLVFEACFPLEETGRHTATGNGDNRPAAGETVTPLTQHLLAETSAGPGGSGGGGSGGGGPAARSVWPVLRTVEDGETWRLPWATSRACLQLRRVLLGAAHMPTDEGKRIPNSSEEDKEEETGTTTTRDSAVTTEEAQVPVIHTRVTAGRYRPRSSGGAVTLAPAPVRTVFGFVRPGPS